MDNEDLIDLDDDEAVNAFLKDAAASSRRVVEKNNIEPQAKTSESLSNQGSSKDPNWIELMPAIPGMTVKPSVDARQSRAKAIETSPIRKPGYEDAKEQIETGFVSPSGGLVNAQGGAENDGVTKPIITQSAADAAKDSMPRIQGPQ